MPDREVSSEPWVEILKGMPAGPSGEFVASFLDLIDRALSKALPPAIDKALLNMGYTEEIAGLVHLLAARSDDAKEEVLRKALTLYSMALDARERGNRLAILNPEDVIVNEVVGFEPVRNDLHPVAH